MRKTVCLLVLLLCLFLPLTTMADLESLTLTGGMPIGEEKTIEYIISDKLGDDHTEATVHAFHFQELDNGYVRFILEYTMPEGLSVFVFNAGNAVFTMKNDTPTSAERRTLQFDLNIETLSAVEAVNIAFQGEKRKAFYVLFYTDELIPDDAPHNPPSFRLSSGKPIGAAIPIDINLNDQLPEGHDRTDIISYQYQMLNNLSVRFTMEYYMPDGLKVSVVDTAGTKLRLEADGKTVAGEGIIQFDIDEKRLRSMGGFNVNFYNRSGSISTFFRTFDFGLEATLTDGEPIGKVKKIKPYIYNELKDGFKPVIHSWTYQELDNGNIRFTIQYTMPEGLNISVFNDGNGDLIRLASQLPTGSEKSTIQYEISKAELSAVKEITMSFYEDDTNRCFVTFILNNSFQ